ncbi:hypothetical protein C8039_10520 [Halogeometricum sp. wsp3]|nr:hypothetical protein C8039_10520 [Halogeometricum sp. wsp3]
MKRGYAVVHILEQGSAMTLELAGVGAYAPQTYVTRETIRDAWLYTLATVSHKSVHGRERHVAAEVATRHRSGESIHDSSELAVFHATVARPQSGPAVDTVNGPVRKYNNRTFVISWKGQRQSARSVVCRRPRRIHHPSATFNR